MTLAEQSTVILEAINDQLLQPEDVVRWADSAIVATEEPPRWLLELSALNSPHMQDYLSRLREHAQGRVSIRGQIEVIVLAHNSGLLTFGDTLSLLFRVAITEREGRELDSVGERLEGALISWDCQEDLDVIESALRSKFEAIFLEVLRDAREIAAVLPWKWRAEPVAAPG